MIKLKCKELRDNGDLKNKREKVVNMRRGIKNITIPFKRFFQRSKRENLEKMEELDKGGSRELSLDKVKKRILAEYNFIEKWSALGSAGPMVKRCAYLIWQSVIGNPNCNTPIPLSYEDIVDIASREAGVDYDEFAELMHEFFKGHGDDVGGIYVVPAKEFSEWLKKVGSRSLAKFFELAKDGEVHYVRGDIALYIPPEEQPS